MRRFLDRLYEVSGALAALCLAGILVVMLAQSFGREAGVFVRGADDIVAWLCAASAFLALGHTFRHGELIRLGLLIERLPPRLRRASEVVTLSFALAIVGYIVYAAARFTYESWKFKEVAQGLIQIPIWIPQASFVLGATVFFIAVLDELMVLLRGGRPAYLAAQDERRQRKDFTETV